MTLSLARDSSLSLHRNCFVVWLTMVFSCLCAIKLLSSWERNYMIVYLNSLSLLSLPKESIGLFFLKVCFPSKWCHRLNPTITHVVMPKASQLLSLLCTFPPAPQLPEWSFETIWQIMSLLCSKLFPLTVRVKIKITRPYMTCTVTPPHLSGPICYPSPHSSWSILTGLLS